MGVSTSEVGYTSATARWGDHESSYEHVVALDREKNGNTKFRQFIYVTFKLSVDFLHSTSASQRKTG